MIIRILRTVQQHCCEIIRFNILIILCAISKDSALAILGLVYLHETRAIAGRSLGQGPNLRWKEAISRGGEQSQMEERIKSGRELSQMESDCRWNLVLKPVTGGLGARLSAPLREEHDAGECTRKERATFGRATKSTWTTLNPIPPLPSPPFPPLPTILTPPY